MFRHARFKFPLPHAGKWDFCEPRNSEPKQTLLVSANRAEIVPSSRHPRRTLRSKAFPAASPIFADPRTRAKFCTVVGSSTRSGKPSSCASFCTTIALLVILITVTKVFALSAIYRQSVEIRLLTLNPPGYPEKQIFIAGRTATILLSRHCRNFLRLRSAGPGFAI